MLNFTTLLIKQPLLSPRKYLGAPNPRRYYQYRDTSWNLLPPPVREQRQIQARQQAKAETDWAEALNFPKHALVGLYLIFGISEICKEKLLDP